MKLTRIRTFAIAIAGLLALVLTIPNSFSAVDVVFCESETYTQGWVGGPMGGTTWQCVTMSCYSMATNTLISRDSCCEGPGATGCPNW